MDTKAYKSGQWLKGYQYKYFLPNEINHEWLISDTQLQKKIETVSYRLGELNSLAKFAPDIDLFIHSHITKEAVTSSLIEGTRTNMEQALTEERFIDPDFRDDWKETSMYVKAMNFALERLKKIPLSNRLIKDTHKILLSHVRGRNKNPGEFRRSQNWIGGATIDKAIFVPPSPEHIGNLMSDFEKFLHNDKTGLPHVARIALAHYQFETIHPFLDGNGRIGRLLITLYLVSVGVLDKPLLYTSDYFNKNRNQYFDKLTMTREKNDLTGWLSFFLEAVESTAAAAASSVNDILSLREKITNETISTLGRKSKNARILLDILFAHTIVTAQLVEKEMGLSPKTVNGLLRDFVSLGILKEITGYKRNRMFEFADYLNIIRR